ncbi:uncharacterized protein BO80DRAFT_52678 [Aspergillus ibericus CBS 121593]|uniref:Uncharacterized protein n=1 Tax=Aspergillus ibericus CBS 121593 TaxID=1448316 RepID=A0A395H169_9EURO|nr:hypothetical protein BO80DRAFT_52678 [Aspergillus ibericus CBS 121593]RAL01621.1 hypothetical protein BO80DRAFT_52678 [Aspergillus ibericus CBS 121593]
MNGHNANQWRWPAVAKNRSFSSSRRHPFCIIPSGSRIILRIIRSRPQQAMTCKGLCPVPDSLLLISNRANPLGPADARHGRQDWLANARATASSSPAKPRDLIRPPLGRFTFEPFSSAPGLAAMASYIRFPWRGGKFDRSHRTGDSPWLDLSPLLPSPLGDALTRWGWALMLGPEELQPGAKGVKGDG